jgi:class 3 adenylate cyclase
MVEAWPSGTVTFLFTDVEGSTRLWEDHEVAMRAALARHDEIVRSAIEDNDGYVFSTAGDAFSAALSRASDAVAAAATAQRHLNEEAWPDDVAVGVRMGLHTGEAQERGGDYFGPDANRAARVMGAANAGQVLLSSSTAELLGRDRLTDLGEPTASRIRDVKHSVLSLSV